MGVFNFSASISTTLFSESPFSYAIFCQHSLKDCHLKRKKETFSVECWRDLSFRLGCNWPPSTAVISHSRLRNSRARRHASFHEHNANYLNLINRKNESCCYPTLPLFMLNAKSWIAAKWAAEKCNKSVVNDDNYKLFICLWDCAMRETSAPYIDSELRSWRSWRLRLGLWGFELGCHQLFSCTTFTIFTTNLWSLYF